MTVKADASSWTGLSPDASSIDVAMAQKPVPGRPEPLEPTVFRERMINWGNAVSLIPIWAALAFVGADDLSLSLLFLAIGFAAFIAVSAGVHFWSLARSHPPALVLSEDGFHCPKQFETPIPWSKIGKIEYTYGRAFRWISVQVDRDHELVLRPIWPLKHLSSKARTQKQPVQILSCWNLDADADALIVELERFRDNYCGTAPSR